VQRGKRGGAEEVEQRVLCRCRGDAGAGAEVMLQSRCRGAGAEVPYRCRCICAGAGAEVVQRCRCRKDG